MDKPTDSLPAEVTALAGRMYDAARTGDLVIFQQTLPAGLPPNMTNEKGDTLVRDIRRFFNRSVSLHHGAQR